MSVCCVPPEILNAEVDMSKIIPFEDRPITTMVAICSLNPVISIPEAFTLLPITQIKIPETKNNTKNLTLPHHSVPGSILSMRFEQEIRGVIVNTVPKKHFRNSITIDMSIATKNVNFRLSSSTLHICGVKSFEQIHETVDLVFGHLKSIQEELNYVGQNPEKAQKCFRYIQMNILKKDRLFIPQPNEIKSGINAEDIDLRIFNFFCRNLFEHNFAKDFLIELEWIMKRQSVYTGDLTLLKVETSMINKNYDIGFEINRQALSQYIRGIDGFYQDYDNAINHSVKVMLPFEIVEGSGIRRKKKKGKIPHHTFMVYKSGCCTHSSPNIALGADAYYRFFTVMLKLRPLIERRSPLATPIPGIMKLRINIIKDIDEESLSKEESPKEPRIEDITESV